MKFIKDLQVELTNRKNREAVITARLAEHNRLQEERDKVQQKLNETLDESLLGEITRLQTEINAQAALVGPITRGKNHQYRVRVENDIQKEIEDYLMGIGIAEKKLAIQKAMDAYAAAISAYKDAYNDVSKELSKLTGIQKHVDLEVLNQFKKTLESCDQLHCGDIKLANRSYNFEHMLELAAPTWGAINQRLLELDGR